MRAHRAAPPSPANRAIEVRFSPLTKRDMPVVLRIEELTFPEPWSAQIFASELALKDQRSYQLARVGRRVAGYFGLMFVDDDAHVTTVAVAPELQGRGFGTALMLQIVRTALEHDSRNLSLEVATGNTRAQSLYRSFGLGPIGVRKRYYPATGEDAIVMMVRDIPSASYARRLERLETGLRSRP